MAKGKDQKAFDIQAIIDKAVNAGIRAGYVAANQTPSNTYKATEKRLYAYPDLLKRIEDNKELLRDIATEGAPEHSKSIARFGGSGVRLSQDEIIEGLMTKTNEEITRDTYEVETIAGALALIKADPYYIVVTARYFEGKNDDQIAEAIPCDVTTVRRNRGRLVRRLAVRLYGAEAL